MKEMKDVRHQEAGGRLSGIPNSPGAPSADTSFSLSWREHTLGDIEY